MIFYFIQKFFKEWYIILKQILNIIYPQVCSICGSINSQALCSKCNTKLNKGFSFQTDNYSKNLNKNFVEHHYFFKYENLIRDQIISLKFHEKPYICETISNFFKNNKKSFEKLKKYDIIIIVPISNERKKERGYNA